LSCPLIIFVAVTVADELSLFKIFCTTTEQNPSEIV